MERLRALQELNAYLLQEMPEYQRQAQSFQENEIAQWQLFRSLVNVRPPANISQDFLQMQDALLKDMLQEKRITNFSELVLIDGRIYLWKGDITTLKIEAIVNAANAQMLGCFYPCHGCIDNAIHTYAGVQLRLACDALMKKQGYEEPIGKAKLTKAYNLPSTYILHTVGPTIYGSLKEEHRRQLASCYLSVLQLASKNGIQEVAFCCISTGEFHFPNEEAAKIAVSITKAFLKTHPTMKVVFNVFKEEDAHSYRRLLNA